MLPLPLLASPKPSPHVVPTPLIVSALCSLQSAALSRMAIPVPTSSLSTSIVEISQRAAQSTYLCRRKKGLRGSPQLQPQTMEPLGEFRLDAQTTSSRHADASIPAPGVPLSESAGSASEVAPRDRFRSVRPIRVRDLSTADGAGLAARLGQGQGLDGEVGACAPQ